MDNWEKEQRNFAFFYRTREGSRGLNWGRWKNNLDMDGFF